MKPFAAAVTVLGAFFATTTSNKHEMPGSCQEVKQVTGRRVGGALGGKERSARRGSGTPAVSRDLSGRVTIYRIWSRR